MLVSVNKFQHVCFEFVFNVERSFFIGKSDFVSYSKALWNNRFGNQKNVGLCTFLDKKDKRLLIDNISRALGLL